MSNSDLEVSVPGEVSQGHAGGEGVELGHWVMVRNQELGFGLCSKTQHTTTSYESNDLFQAEF